MENEKVLSKIVSERADTIQSEATERIKQIQERTEEELRRIVPDLLKQIENFSVFKLLDVLDVIRNGGIVKTCDYETEWESNHWRLDIGNTDVFYPTDSSQGRRELAKGRYRITLIMEKLGEKPEG